MGRQETAKEFMKLKLCAENYEYVEKLKNTHSQGGELHLVVLLHVPLQSNITITQQIKNLDCILIKRIKNLG